MRRGEVPAPLIASTRNCHQWEGEGRRHDSSGGDWGWHARCSNDLVGAVNGWARTEKRTAPFTQEKEAPAGEDETERAAGLWDPDISEREEGVRERERA
jgi:hypothetical protein